MNRKRTVSIIIPAKNEAAYLGQCLEALDNAILDYGKENVEVIIVDNGSIDSTIEIAKCFNVKIIYEPHVKTIAKLRNIGARIAQNEFCAFLDADCLVHEKWITVCIKILEDNDEIGAIGTPAVPDIVTGTWVEKCLYKLMAGSSARSNKVKWLGSSNIFIHKSLFFAVGGFDEDMITAEDVNLSYAIIRKGKINYLEKSIHTIHLRESKDLYQLFKREYWRGRNSLSSWIKNRYPWEEFPSIVFPLINAICWILIIIMLFNNILSILIATVVIIGIFPLLILIRKKALTFSLIDDLRCYSVAFVYLFARSVAIMHELFELLVNFIKRTNNTYKQLF